jgi:hypothetical protein
VNKKEKDISSFNMTIREDGKVNRLIESLESFRQIWVNRYLYHISIILFLNKYDIFVEKIVQQNCKLEDYFPDYKFYQLPSKIDKHLTVPNEHPEITRAKMFILELFIQITNEKLIDSMVKVATKSDDNSILPIQNGLEFDICKIPWPLADKCCDLAFSASKPRPWRTASTRAWKV